MQSKPVARARTRGGYSRNREGCLTCRQRKKRCDLVQPTCGHCSRLNLVCRREAPREIIQQQVPDAANDEMSLVPTGGRHDGSIHLPPHLESIPQDIRSLYDGDDASDLVASRRLMLRYYTGSFVFLLTTNVQNNCFLSTFLPMAFECKTLMKALAAWSAAHLAIRDPSFQSLALRHSGSAIGNFKVAMEDESISPEMCLATTMVLCSMETISGGTGAWYAHLQGGVAALRGQSSSSRDSEHVATDIHPTNMRLFKSVDGRWLLRNLAYHDALSSVSLDRRPMLQHVYANLDEDTIPDPYFGVAARVIQLLAQTSELKADMAEAAQADAELDLPSPSQGARLDDLPHQPEESFSARARSIETQLLDWRYPAVFDKTPLGYLGEAYRFAALLHLFHTLELFVASHTSFLRAKIRNTARATCDAIRALPEDSLAECTLLFPLFMAGAATVLPEQVGFIRRRLERMNRLRGFRNVELCSVVLEEVWAGVGFDAAESDEQAWPRDWLEIAKEKGWQIALT